jgi:hypothetical protein
MTLGQWNRQESACWNRLRTALARSYDGMAYIGAVEVQKRGALHRHLMIWTPEPLVPAEVQALAQEAGYGCVFDVQPVDDVRKAARYVSKYITKSAGDRGNVPWTAEVLDEQTGELRELSTVPTFRTWSSSQNWGFTVKGLREVMMQQARARAMYLRELADLLALDAPDVPAVAGPAPTDSPSSDPP